MSFGVNYAIFHFQAQLGQNTHAVESLRVKKGQFRGAISKIKDGQGQTQEKYGRRAPNECYLCATMDPA